MSFFLQLINSLIPVHYKIQRHIKKYFYKKTEIVKKKSVILVELNELSSNTIISLYLLKVLNFFFLSEVFVYKIPLKNIYLTKIQFFLRNFFKIGSIGIYTAFGVKKFILSIEDSKKAIFIYKDILLKIKKKSDIEKIRINNILIGDLIYDSYLLNYKRPTINFSSSEFLNYLYQCIKIFIYWENFFKKNSVKAVIVSHTVYLNAMPLRIAIKNNILAFQTNLKSIYYLNKKEPFAYKQYKFYPKIFSKFKKKDKIKFIKSAKQRLNLRFEGQVGVDMFYSNKSAYKNYKKFRIIKKSQKIKILVAAHCFFDSPHSYGNNFFCDFYEWLEFLGKVSLKTDYDWYIKTHPDFYRLSEKVIKNFINKYDKFNFLEADSSHNQIIKEDIDFALTIYGTIAVEYAAKGVPVINASINNPHIKYNFSINPKNLHSYEKILMKLSKIKLKINKDKVYEYYFMNNLYYENAMLYGNYYSLLNNIGGYKKTLDSNFYKYFLNNFNVDEHKLLISKIKNYIRSKQYISDIFFKNLDNKVNKYII